MSAWGFYRRRFILNLLRYIQKGLWQVTQYAVGWGLALHCSFIAALAALLVKLELYPIPNCISATGRPPGSGDQALRLLPFRSAVLACIMIALLACPSLPALLLS